MVSENNLSKNKKIEIREITKTIQESEKRSKNRDT